MAANEDIVALLRSHTGMADVQDLVEVCAALADEDVLTYLQAFIENGTDANAVAARIVAERGSPQEVAAPIAAEAAPPTGATVYRKKDEAEDFFVGKAGKAKAPAVPAASKPTAPVVGGASAVHVSPKKGKKGASVSVKGIEGLGRALLEGRHPCNCNARRHELLYNCLSCGKVICAQEGAGPCLFCGNDPDVENGHGVTGDASKALERKELLLEFDRSSAKRTTVDVDTNGRPRYSKL